MFIHWPSQPWVSCPEGMQGLQDLAHCALPLGASVCRLPLATSARIWVSSGDPEKRVPQKQNWEAVFLSLFTSG